MIKETLYTTDSYLREEFKIEGFRFGSTGEDSEPSACIVGSMRGNEFQQLFICSLLVKRLKELEASGSIVGNHEILVIPSLNNSSMNVGMRYWYRTTVTSTGSFGESAGRADQPSCASIFAKVKGYRYGIQFPSFYRKGDFIPHVRMQPTGKESASLANLFGLPYVITSKQRSFDVKTLNYNWQINGTDAFSVYSGDTGHINEFSAKQAVSAVLRFLTIIKFKI